MRHPHPRLDVRRAQYAGRLDYRDLYAEASQEWIRFLNQIKRSVPKDKQIHIICDNYATHKHQKVVNWLKRNTRFHVHFTAASWLNMVERFFRDLSTASARGFPFGS